MKIPTTMAIFSGLFLVGGVASGFPQLAQVGEVRIAGSGCPVQTVNWERLSDGLRIRTPAYTSSISGNDRIERSNCQAIIEIRKPAGWTYRVTQVEVTGTARLVGNIDGRISNTHYIQGVANTYSSESTIPQSLVQSNFRYTNRQRGDWAPCNTDRALNVNTAIVLTRDQGAAGYGSLRVNPNTRIWLEWQSC